MPPISPTRSAWQKHNSNVQAALTAAIVFALALGGCAVAPPARSAPKLDATWFAGPPIGKVTPVYLELKCSANCEALPATAQPFITPADVLVLNNDDQYVATLSLDEAIAQAGGAIPLADAVSNTSGLAVVGQAAGGSTLAGVLAVPYGAAVGLGTPAAGPLGLVVGAAAGAVAGTAIIIGGLGYSTYLALSPEGRARYKLRQEILDSNEPSSSNAQEKGWVFLPADEYKEVKLTVLQIDLVSGVAEATRNHVYVVEVLRVPLAVKPVSAPAERGSAPTPRIVSSP